MAQFVMLWCMFMSFVYEEAETDFAQSEWVLYVKLPCSLALHVYLYPEVQKGMALMKYANNQPHQFVESGSEISFTLGYIQFFLSVFTEAINIYLLAYQYNVERCIIHFVALEVIMELNKIYLESLTDNTLKSVLHCHPVVEKKSKDIKFSDRSCFHKVARIVYKTSRSIYVSIIFYFVPFYVIYLNF